MIRFKPVRNAALPTTEKSQSPAARFAARIASAARFVFAAFVRRFRYWSNAFLFALCPPLWRRFFGRPRRRGDRFEDICENFNRPTPNPKDVLGLAGERVAFDYFRADPNCDVVACGVETFACEIDLIFIDKKTRELAIVEVKTRRRENSRYPTLDAVDARRRKKLALAGAAFAREAGETRRRLRFDVVVIIWPEGDAPRLTHYRDYFQYDAALRGFRGFKFGRNVGKNDSKESRRR